MKAASLSLALLSCLAGAVLSITPADAQAILDGKPAESKREFVNIQGD